MQGILVSRTKIQFYYKMYKSTECNKFKEFYKNYKWIYKQVIFVTKLNEVTKNISCSVILISLHGQ